MLQQRTGMHVLAPNYFLVLISCEVFQYRRFSVLLCFFFPFSWLSSSIHYNYSLSFLPIVSSSYTHVFFSKYVLIYFRNDIESAFLLFL